MFLSVIVPVYNVESTLRRCVESIISQEIDDIEVILVDDGSPDGSPAICDALAREHGCIQVVHRRNGGLSAARNTGIDLAQGKYITFVDSDDHIAPDTYRGLCSTLMQHPEYDILEFEIEKQELNGSTLWLKLPDREYSDMKDYWLKGKAYIHSYAWNKIYRRELFSKVRFPEGILFEDIHTLPHLLDECKTVATTQQGRYIYCMNQNGITVNATGREQRMLLQAHLYAMKKWCDKTYYSHILNIQITTCELTDDAPQLPTLRYWGTLKLTCLQLLGMERLCRLNKTFRKIWKRKR